VYRNKFPFPVPQRWDSSSLADGGRGGEEGEMVLISPIARQFIVDPRFESSSHPTEYNPAMLLISRFTVL